MAEAQFTPTRTLLGLRSQTNLQHLLRERTFYTAIMVSVINAYAYEYSTPKRRNYLVLGYKPEDTVDIWCRKSACTSTPPPPPRHIWYNPCKTRMLNRRIFQARNHTACYGLACTREVEPGLGHTSCRGYMPCCYSFCPCMFPAVKEEENRHHNLETRGNILHWFVLSQCLVRVPVSLM